MDYDNMDFTNYTNEQIGEMIKTQGLENITYEELIAKKNKRIKEFFEQDSKLQEAMLRHWLLKRKNKHLIDFNDKERSQLKQYFNSLDEDGSSIELKFKRQESIGIDELEEPLISLGIAESREDVKKLIYTVDDDGSIEFKEFLEIIKNKNGDGKSNSKETMVIDFFKDMINGRLGHGSNQPINKNLPFSLIISTIRRQKLLDALMANDPKKKEEGEKVMKAYGKLISQRRAQKNDGSIQGSKKRI